MKIRHELQAIIAFIEHEQPILCGFFSLITNELENVEDELLENYVENDVGSWGILTLLAMNSVELNMEYSTAYIDNVLRFAKEGFATGDRETAH
ncbi:hypothetical protein EK599_12190 [Vibrio sp. T187]|uniref:hypothetical protein n=1 Tax=Vibrio TaxID=662 RepID=UPI0010C98E4E|nr:MULTISPECIES: hypothetical protein [Vibrio]MBW3696456.1 hypothetical protein [Vibrio sp. T187]